MDGQRFDAITRALARNSSRRTILGALAAGAAGAVLGMAGRPSAGAIGEPCKKDADCGPCTSCEGQGKNKACVAVAIATRDPRCGAGCCDGDGTCTNDPTTCSVAGPPETTCGNSCPGGQCKCGGILGIGKQCVDPTSSRDHCGGCGRVCDAAQDCCNGTCVDKQNNAANCGQCGFDCAQMLPGSICSAGTCQCGGDTKQCGAACIPIGNCCANSECGTGKTCQGGTCACDPNLPACEDGQTRNASTCACEGGDPGGGCSIGPPPDNGCPAGEFCYDNVDGSGYCRCVEPSFQTQVPCGSPADCCGGQVCVGAANMICGCPEGTLFCYDTTFPYSGSCRPFDGINLPSCHLDTCNCN